MNDLLAAAQRLDLGDIGATQNDLDALAQPTPESEVKWREGPKGRSLAYVDARWVMDRLDSIVPGLWQRDHRMTESGKVACGIGIYMLGLGWVWRWDGAGETDIEGEKGSFSDSFKRAAVSWGIARDLYDKGSSVPQGASVPRAAEQAPRVEQPPRAAQDGYGDPSVCPFHNKPWKLGNYGYYCTSKAAPNGPANARGYCNAKPTAAWAAAHEVA